jgi:hypothetical protein
MLLLTRAGVPDTLLRPGQLLVARVVDVEGARGRLSLAGALLDAELPEGTKAGQTLRLQVQEATPERLVLRLEPPPVLVAPAVALPLPGGAAAQVRAGDAGEHGAEDAPGEHGAPAVSVTYESPRLGALDFRLVLRASELTCEVAARAGEAADAARERLAELREALLGLGVRATVEIVLVERHDPFDAYA